MSWLRQDGDAALLTLHIQPGAKSSAISGRHGEALKIRLAAPPIDGRANDALIEFLAKKIGVPKARIELVAGLSSRAKRVRVAGVTAAAVQEALDPANEN